MSHSTGYTYDAAGRKSSENNDERSVNYSFDVNSNRFATIWPDGYTVYYAYDALNRMSCVTEGSASTNELAYYTYDPLSRRQTVRLGGNAANCASAISSTNQLTYSYSNGGELLNLANQLNTTTVSMGYQYNPSRQIKQLSLINGTDPFYLPDPLVSAPTSYTPNARNEYGSIDGGSLTYDNNGNLLNVPASATVPAQSFTYDTENHLVTASVPSLQSGAITYDYDGLGRRVSKTVGSTSTTYLLDGDEEISEYSSSALLRRYVTGPVIDDRIAHVEGASTTAAPTGSTHTYYHVNHQGSVLAVTDYTGAVVSCTSGTACQRMAYDEYGNLSSAASAIGEAFRYTGRRFDPETGLYYYRARYYSPQLGRFLQTDPVGYKDDLNLYAYVGNDPLDKTDPSGLSSLDFDGTANTITFTTSDGDTSTFTAYNNVDSKSNGKWADGSYSYDGHTTHKDDGPNSAFGSNGNFKFNVSKRPNMGVHSGREATKDKAGRQGPAHATEGCIRITDAGTAAIKQAVDGGDPLTTITVRNNSPATPPAGTGSSAPPSPQPIPSTPPPPTPRKLDSQPGDG